MAITQALSNALSGLSVAKRGAEVSSSNIANALTEGYGVRELALRARDVGGYGAGVEVAGLSRNVDPFVLAERRLSDADMGHRKALHSANLRLEKTFGEPGSKSGLHARVTDLENKLLKASGDPASQPRLAEAYSSLKRLAGEITNTAETITAMREQSEANISNLVDKLNSALKGVDRLNDDIVRIGNLGQPTAGLYDQRQQLIDSISDIVSLRQISRDGGRVALFTADGEALLDHRPREIGFQPAGKIAPQMNVGSGALKGLTIDGHPAAGNGPVGLLGGGALAAEFMIRDTISVKAQKQLDEFADDLRQRLADNNVDPTIAAGADGLLRAAAAYGPGVEGLANVIAVNPSLDNPSKLRDGLGAVTSGPSGNGAVLQGWANNLAKTSAYSAGMRPESIAGRAATIAASMSSARVSGERELSFSTSKRDGLKQAELAKGVDTDAEMQKLMQLEQAYAANAKVIQTIDQMMRHLLEI